MLALHFKLEALVDDVCAVAEMDVLERQDALAASAGLRKTEIDRRAVGDRRLDFFHALDLLEFALGLSGLGVFGEETVHEEHEAVDFALLIFVGGEEVGFVGLALGDELLVISAVTLELAETELDDGIDDLVQELAIMRDHEDGAGIILEMILEPEE